LDKSFDNTTTLMISNANFGVSDFIGNKLYEIFKVSQVDITVLCIKNISEIKQHNIKSMFFGFEYLSKLKETVFNYVSKKEILRHDVVHFFFCSVSLVRYAKDNNKKVIIDANEMRDDCFDMCYKMADIIISNSDEQTRYLVDIDIDKSKIVQIIDNPNKIIELYQ